MSLPWIKVYGSLFEHPRAVDLGDELGNPMAWAHLVALWSWCAEYAPEGLVSGRSPDRAIERAARWTGEHGQFVAAALLTGWLERDGEGVRVCGWDEHQKAHLDKAEKDRERLAQHRAKVRSVVGVVSRDSSATVARQSCDGSATVAGEIERRGEEKEQVPCPPAAADGPVAVGNVLVLEPPANDGSKPVRPTAAPPVPTGDVAVVWARYLLVSPASRFTKARGELIRKWLPTYPAADLVRSIDGYAKSPHHNGQNDSGAKYLSLELFLRDAKHIEAGWALATAGPPRPMTTSGFHEPPRPRPSTEPPAPLPEATPASIAAARAAVEKLGLHLGRDAPPKVVEMTHAEIEARRELFRQQRATLEAKEGVS